MISASFSRQQLGKTHDVQSGFEDSLSDGLSSHLGAAAWVEGRDIRAQEDLLVAVSSNSGTGNKEAERVLSES